MDGSWRLLIPLGYFLIVRPYQKARDRRAYTETQYAQALNGVSALVATGADRPRAVEAIITQYRLGPVLSERLRSGDRLNKPQLPLDSAERTIGSLLSSDEGMLRDREGAIHYLLGIGLIDFDTAQALRARKDPPPIPPPPPPTISRRIGRMLGRRRAAK